MNTKYVGLMIAGILSIAMTVASADNRSFVWTYEYQTMEAGAAEL